MRMQWGIVGPGRAWLIKKNQSALRWFDSMVFMVSKSTMYRRGIDIGHKKQQTEKGS
jgi:hypothetical protein